MAPDPKSQPSGSGFNSDSSQTKSPESGNKTESIKNPLVFLDIAIDDVPVGRLVIQLYADQVPKTAENFRCLCTGEIRGPRGKRLSYKGTSIFSVIQDWVCIGGDIENDNGTGGLSIYGKYFRDENTIVPHDSRGIVSMMSFKNNTNNSQFFINFGPAPHLDVQHVAFGKIVDGFSVLDKIEANGDRYGMPISPVKISDCDELSLKTSTASTIAADFPCTKSFLLDCNHCQSAF